MSEQPPEKPRIVGSDGELLEPDKSSRYQALHPVTDDDIADEQPLLSVSPVEVLNSPHARNQLRKILLMALGAALAVLLLVLIIQSSRRVSEDELPSTPTMITDNPLPGSVTDAVRVSNLSNTPITDVEWSPDGTQLAVNNYGGRTRIWDGQTGREVLALDDNLIQLWWSPDGTRMLGSVEGAGGYSDTQFVIWDLQTGARAATLPTTGDSYAIRLAWSLDGSTIAVTADRTLTLYSAQTGWTLQTLDINSSTSNYAILPILWTEGGLFIIRSSSILRWDRTLDVPEIFQQRDVSSSRWTAAASSDDGRYLAVASTVGHSPDITVQVFVWDTSSDSTEPIAQLTPFTHQEYNPVRNIFLSPDGTQLAIVHNAEVMLWDIASGTQTRSIELTADVTDVDWSPDGTHLAVCSRESVRIYALAGLEEDSG